MELHQAFWCTHRVPFNRNKIPGSTLTQLAIDSGSSVPFGGKVNPWSFTINPHLLSSFTKKTGAYVTGGGGFYRKVTNFTAPVLGESCYYYCYIGYYPTTIAHSSSNQGGLNIGAAFYWKAFGEDNNAKLFAEAQHLWVDSPVAKQPESLRLGHLKPDPGDLRCSFLTGECFTCRKREGWAHEVHPFVSDLMLLFGGTTLRWS